MATSTRFFAIRYPLPNNRYPLPNFAELCRLACMLQHVLQYVPLRLQLIQQ